MLKISTLFLVASLVTGFGNQKVLAQQSVQLLGSDCTPDLDHPVTEPATGRTFVIDFPCDLRSDEEVTVILNLHGGGSNTRYQHGYFPAFEYKEQFRLIVATPYSPVRRWSEVDDAYLQNIVSLITAAVGSENIRALWLAGHSQGGSTSRRLVCTEFFRDKVDGFLSLSGGRLGGSPQRSPDAGRPRQADDPPPAARTTPPTLRTEVEQPDCDFSHIFAIGEHEIVELPTTSTWAERYHCAARVQRPDVVDTEAGHVHDSGHQNPATKAWGRLPRGGTSQVFVYPDCDDGRVVADVIRVDKGHTEGLEPNVVKEILRLMVSASGGKIQG
ncbi:MAG: hypothetical protein R3F41_16180 [Gammaproteobacteria bacterium]|nr:hypothetical protein [Pseudomonadales bacterium]MCP5346689.1 hypothetical protein [Pseudomonadales bacterium]